MAFFLPGIYPLSTTPNLSRCGCMYSSFSFFFCRAPYFLRLEPWDLYWNVHFGVVFVIGFSRSFLFFPVFSLIVLFFQLHTAPEMLVTTIQVLTTPTNTYERVKGEVWFFFFLIVLRVSNRGITHAKTETLALTALFLAVALGEYIMQPPPPSWNTIKKLRGQPYYSSRTHIHDD